MAKKNRNGDRSQKAIPITISLSARDLEALQDLRIEDGQHRSSVIREAIDALREKRRYTAKRVIERSALPPKSEPLREAIVERRLRSPSVLEEEVRPRVTTN
ncbi:ribbon-helix-helix protein, CopG family [Bradyrhizobium sp. DASA03007]|uniref:ribbon-helix-helix protein, CopG family n=1 Tax=unclassified Bradyrhizobium TaxID=2631580 RepID=UPI003F6F2892